MSMAGEVNAIAKSHDALKSRRVPEAEILTQRENFPGIAR
jgi:hypothetical protein